MLDVECFPRPLLQVCFIKTRTKQHHYVVLFKHGFRIFSNIKTWFILSENGLEQNMFNKARLKHVL